MSKRKSFNNLSKSQKNRRIKKEYDSLLEMPGGPSCDAEKITVKEVIQSKTDGEYADNVKSLNNLQAIPISENYCHVVSSVESDVNEETSTENNTSTDNELYDILESEKTVDLKEQMAQWICHNNVTHTAARALLKILRNNVQSVQQLRELPEDPRTLLNTPRSTVIRSVPPGEYFHYGLQKGLIDQLKTVGVNKISENIQINVHIDGLPISKSSKSQLYPILAEIFPKVAEPFVVGIYHGYNKPDRCDVFLQEFIKEYSTLQKQGFQYYDRTFKIIIRAIICDSPARSFVTCTKGHNGFFGCGKCMQEGEYEDRRMLFLEMDAPLRTDDNFLQRVNEDHHIGKSIFEKVNIGMVSQFPVEYMHLVCLGVTKKMLKAFIKGWHVNENQIVKFNSKMMKEISEYLILSRKWIPTEFARKTRSLDELDRWKATELRFFLLYVGSLALKNHLSSEYLYHFNTLHCAIRILCHETNCIHNNECAKNLLRFFVKESIELYGRHFVIFNVHNLIHLADDVMRFGYLDSFSAFAFESYLNNIKKHLRKGEKPLQQLHKRIVEQASCSYLQKNNAFIKPQVSNYNTNKSKENGVPSYDKINYKTFTLSVRQTSDKFCYVKNYDVLRIENICIKNNDIILQGETLMNSVNLENYPINSQSMNIIVGNNWSTLKDFTANDVILKAVCLPHDKNFCFFPLLHSSA